MSTTRQELTGHTSPDTAYVVNDYPYGFRLRCQIRYWIETKAGHGQRTVSQTTNPKRAGVVWNSPKPSTYSPIRVLYLDTTTGHVGHDGLSGYADEGEIAAFVAQYPHTAAEPDNRKRIDYMIARRRAEKHVTYKIVPAGEAPTYTREEEIAIMRKLTIAELHKMQAERGEV